MALQIDEDVEVIEVESQREQVNVITTTSPKEKEEREEIETFRLSLPSVLRLIPSSDVSPLVTANKAIMEDYAVMSCH